MTEGRIRFSKLFTLHVNNLIKKYMDVHPPGANGDVSTEVLKGLRVVIMEQVDRVFTRGNHRMTAESRSWLADQFFKMIQINGNHYMGDQVVIHEYKLSDLPYDDVELMKNLFDQTMLAEMLNEDFKKRSLS
jgi:hypothetical protein